MAFNPHYLSDTAENVCARRYYLNGIAKITHESVSIVAPQSSVWQSNVVARNFKRIEIIKSIEKLPAGSYITFTPEGTKCEFLRFLANTSCDPKCFTPEFKGQLCPYLSQHLVNKITTIGYLLCPVRFEPIAKAVVLRDSQARMTGASEGGTGKSIFAHAIGEIAAQYKMCGSELRSDGYFASSDMTTRVENILIEDFRADYSVRYLFNYISSGMTINRRGRETYWLPNDLSPKLLITTNSNLKHADDGSARRRLAFVDFSGWYNRNHRPLDDFCHSLFFDWDEYQWILFDNFMAECVMYYLHSCVEEWGTLSCGIVEAPITNTFYQ